MKQILLIITIVFLFNIKSAAQADKEIIRRDTFVRFGNEVRYIFRTYWEKHEEYAPVLPVIDTMRVIGLLDSFFTNVVYKQMPGMRGKVSFSVTLGITRAPWNMDLGYGVSILVKGLKNTAAEGVRFYRSYSKDVKWKKHYDEVWLASPYLLTWNNKWLEAFTRKLKRRKFL